MWSEGLTQASAYVIQYPKIPLGPLGHLWLSALLTQEPAYQQIV